MKCDTWDGADSRTSMVDCWLDDFLGSRSPHLDITRYRLVIRWWWNGLFSLFDKRWPPTRYQLRNMFVIALYSAQYCSVGWTSLIKSRTRSPKTKPSRVAVKYTFFCLIFFLIDCHCRNFCKSLLYQQQQQLICRRLMYWSQRDIEKYNQLAARDVATCTQ